MTSVGVDVWDLRHLLLSLDDRRRAQPDAHDLDGVVARAVEVLSQVPRRPIIDVPAPADSPLLVEGLPLWILETNAWLLAPDGPGGECIVVDVPPAPDALVERITQLELRPSAIFLTHAHFDHIGGTGALLKALAVRVPVYVHPADRSLVLHPDRNGVLARVAGVGAPPARALVPMSDGMVLEAGRLTVRTVHTPGHTPGSTCILVDSGGHRLVFTGDTLFGGGSGRCDLLSGSRAVADESLQSSIAPLPDDTIVLPGHGGITTVGQERSGRLSLPSVAA